VVLKVAAQVIEVPRPASIGMAQAGSRTGYRHPQEGKLALWQGRVGACTPLSWSLGSRCRSADQNRRGQDPRHAAGPPSEARDSSSGNEEALLRGEIDLARAQHEGCPGRVCRLGWRSWRFRNGEIHGMPSHAAQSVP